MKVNAKVFQARYNALANIFGSTIAELSRDLTEDTEYRGDETYLSCLVRNRDESGMIDVDDDVMREFKSLWNTNMLLWEANVTYACDQTKCLACDGSVCKHTHDIRHAKNFREVAPGYYEETL